MFWQISVKGSRLQERISGGQSFQYDIHNRYSKDCHNGAGNNQTEKQLCVTIMATKLCVVLLIMDSHGVTHLFRVFLLQILGAFAVRDGVPMQGMKIKNVVPGKNSVSLWNCLGQSIANVSPRNFAFTTFETPPLFFFLRSWLLLLLVVCVKSLDKEERGGVLLCYHFHFWECAVFISN